MYEAYGGIVLSTGSSQNNRLANTKERDFSIGLDNHGFRYFDPEVGRYISRDPIGYGDGPNVYIYVHSNPINHIDPLGLGWGWLGDLAEGAVNIVVGGAKAIGNLACEVVGAVTDYPKAIAETELRIAENVTGVKLGADYVAAIPDISPSMRAFSQQDVLSVNGVRHYSAIVTMGVSEEVWSTADWANGKISDEEYQQRMGGTATLQLGAAGLMKATAVENAANGVRTASEQPHGGIQPDGSLLVLRDGQGATPGEMAASRGGPTAGQRGAAQQAARARALQESEMPNGGWEGTCNRCGAQSNNPADFHLGHKNVPTSQGGNQTPPNTTLEGAACNLSAGNRGAPSPGMSCAERGGPGMPYGRSGTGVAPASPGTPIVGNPSTGSVVSAGVAGLSSSSGVKE